MIINIKFFLLTTHIIQHSGRTVIFNRMKLSTMTAEIRSYYLKFSKIDHSPVVKWHFCSYLVNFNLSPAEWFLKFTVVNLVDIWYIPIERYVLLTLHISWTNKAMPNDFLSSYPFFIRFYHSDYLSIELKILALAASVLVRSNKK